MSGFLLPEHMTPVTREVMLIAIMIWHLLGPVSGLKMNRVSKQKQPPPVIQGFGNQFLPIITISNLMKLGKKF